MEDKMFTVINENGEEEEYEVVLTFFSDVTNKSYVVYKHPNEEDEEVFAAVYDETKDDGGDLHPIETDEEWDMIEEVLNSFLDEE